MELPTSQGLSEKLDPIFWCCRLTEEYEALKHEYEDLSKKNNELESTLARMHDQVADAQT